VTILRLWWLANRRLILVAGIVVAVTWVVGVVGAWSMTCAPSLTASACLYALNGDPRATLTTAILATLPVLLGLVFGAGAVGGELDAGTAGFAWSVAPDRRRWLAEHIGPGLLATAAFALACGALNAVIVAKINPGQVLPASFVGYGLWGPLVAVRALCAYAVGLALGIWLGRVVTSVTLGLLVLAVILPLALVAGRSFEPANMLVPGDESHPEAIGVGSSTRLPDGTLGTLEDCVRAGPSFSDDPEFKKQDAWMMANCPPVSRFIAGSQMPWTELRESTVLSVLALLAGTLTFRRVRNRRP
jgi:hypothetical protein